MLAQTKLKLSAMKFRSVLIQIRLPVLEIYYTIHHSRSLSKLFATNYAGFDAANANMLKTFINKQRLSRWQETADPKRALSTYTKPNFSIVRFNISRRVS